MAKPETLSDYQGLNSSDKALHTLARLAAGGDMDAGQLLHESFASALSDDGEEELTDFTRTVLAWMHSALANSVDPATAVLMKKGRGNKRKTSDVLRNLEIANAVRLVMRERNITHGDAAEVVHKSGEFTRHSEHDGGAKSLSARRILNIYMAIFLPK